MFLLALLIVASEMRAELPMARLLSAFPPGACAGTSVEIKLSGLDLEEVNRLHFSDARITAKAGPGGVFVVSVPKEIEAGVYDLRAIGRYGISNPRAFVVSSLSEGVNKGGNTSVAAAAPISVGQVINAVADANAVHFYKLSLKKGQRVVARVEARLIDSRMQPVMVLMDAAGDRMLGRDAEVIDFTSTGDGDYLIKVHDFTYRGGAEFFYRLAVDASPQIDFVEPTPGTVGGSGRYVVFGRNLPDGKPAPAVRTGSRTLQQLSVEIEAPRDVWQEEHFAYVPSMASLMEGFDYRLPVEGGLSNAVRIGIASAPVILKDGGSSQAQKISVPCEVVGRFRAREMADCYTFDAPAKSVFWIEVFSNRLGFPTAPFLLIQRVSKDQKGVEKISDVQEVYESAVNMGGPEFKTASRDPAYRLEVKEAGAYRVLVRNLFTTSSEESVLPYRLAIRSESPDFRLIAFPASPLQEKDSKDVPVWSALLRRGGVTPIKVVAGRRDGFGGEIQLAVEGLPPGVICPPATIGPSASSAVLLLTASSDAPACVASLRVSGTAIVNGAAVTRVARAGTVATSAYVAADKALDISSRRARELMIAVSAERSPLAILPAKETTVETCVFNKVSLPFRVLRRGEIVGPIPLKLAGHPLVAPVKEVNLDPAGDTANIELDLSQVKLGAGVYDLHVQSLAKVKYSAAAGTAAKELPASFYSPPIRLIIAASPIVLAPPAAVKIEAGAKQEIPVAITRLYGFADVVEVSLVAPEVKGLSAAAAAIAKDQSAGKLIITSDAATAAGNYVVKLVAKMKVNNQPITIEQPLSVNVVGKPATK